MTRRPRRRWAATAVALGLVGVALVLRADRADRTDRSPPPAPVASPAPDAPEADRPTLPTFAAWEPAAVEPYRNGKRLAGRIAQAITTYESGDTAREVAATVPIAAQPSELAPRIAPLLQRRTSSAGEVIYAQLSGVTPTSLGAMVIVRQHLLSADGERSAVTRVVDVRLELLDGAWALDALGSVGGTPVRRPAKLPAAAERVLDHPRVVLPDSARWDIHRGDVDGGLLETVARAANRRRIAITTFVTGHPRTVWATARTSAHARGYAADIFAVDRRLVVRQRDAGSPAYELAESFVTGQAAQLGSPWRFATAGARSFSDAVHQDHIHVQQAAMAAS